MEKRVYKRILHSMESKNMFHFYGSATIDVEKMENS